jgi:ATP-dependent 26S proteasome regulatory subunit
MFNQTLSSAFTSLAPFWSNEIVKYLEVGNEYNMAINMVLGATITFLSKYLTEFASMVIVGTFALILIFIKYGNVNISNNLILVPQKITMSGFEKIDFTNIELKYSTTMLAINMMLIEKYKIKNLKYFKNTNFDVVVDNVNNLKLENDLYITVLRTNDKGKNDSIVTYILSSYKKDIKQIINEAENNFMKSKNKIITFIGKEDKLTYKYPEPMLCLTYLLVNYYKMDKLKILDCANSIQDDKERPHVNEKKDQTNKESQKQVLIDVNKSIKSLFLVEDCKNYKLVDDIMISIERTNDAVTYTLFSETTDLKDFLKECLQQYKHLINKSTYKYRLKLSGSETWSERDESQVTYSKQILALNHILINRHDIKTFKSIEIDGNIYYMVDNMSSFNIDGIIFSITRNETSTYWTSTSKVEYILESDTVDVKIYVEKCVEEYTDFLNKKNKDILYHFIYNGKVDGKLNFTTNVLHSKENEIYETFDKIYNEHVDNLKKDIAKLKDIEYYKSTGLRRKKSYLFYGDPGCGKTASAVAMALHDNRHIIEIPFTALEKNSELEEVLNLKSIGTVFFEKNEIIYFFDEIDVGIEKFNRDETQSEESKNDSNEQMKNMFTTIALVGAMTKKEDGPSNIKSFSTKDNINMGFILSRFDGIGNYNGLIIIATTTHIEKLESTLYREQRLTPLKFTFLRRFDAVSIIQNFYKCTLADQLIELVPDRKVSPAKLRFLCEKYDDINVEQFVNILNQE